MSAETEVSETNLTPDELFASGNLTASLFRLLEARKSLEFTENLPCHQGGSYSGNMITGYQKDVLVKREKSAYEGAELLFAIAVKKAVASRAC